MSSYLAAFHRHYSETVERFLPGEVRGHLARYAMMPTAIVGYISTMHGAGFEYVGGDGPQIVIKTSSRRIEDLIFDPPARLRVGRASTGIGLEI